MNIDARAWIEGGVRAEDWLARTLRSSADVREVSIDHESRTVTVWMQSGYRFVLRAEGAVGAFRLSVGDVGAERVIITSSIESGGAGIAEAIRVASHLRNAHSRTTILNLREEPDPHFPSDLTYSTDVDENGGRVLTYAHTGRGFRLGFPERYLVSEKRAALIHDLLSRPYREGVVLGHVPHVCTSADPYDPAKHSTPVQHPDAVTVGGSDDGGCDDFKCPHCGTKWRTCYDDD